MPDAPAVEPYSPYPQAIPRAPLAPPRGGRRAHGARLKASFLRAEREAKKERAAAGFEVHGAEPGLYVQFESVPGVPLNVLSLEDQRKGIEVVAVRAEPLPAKGKAEEHPLVVERATVFVPDGQVKHFISRFEKYAREAPKKKGERRHEDMLDRVAALRRATLRALWTDEPEAYPGEAEAIWWEVWLRRTDGDELARFLEFSQHVDLRVGERRLEFDDRIVLIAFGTVDALSSSLDVLEDIAEVRRAKELAGFFTEERSAAQAEWARDLAGRLQAPGAGAPAVADRARARQRRSIRREPSLGRRGRRRRPRDARTRHGDGRNRGVRGPRGRSGLVPSCGAPAPARVRQDPSAREVRHERPGSLRRGDGDGGQLPGVPPRRAPPRVRHGRHLGGRAGSWAADLVVGGDRRARRGPVVRCHAAGARLPPRRRGRAEAVRAGRRERLATGARPPRSQRRRARPRSSPGVECARGRGVRGELDARAAIEVDRIYNSFAQKDMTPGLAEAARKTEQLIERIVQEGWSIRRLEQYAKKAAGSESAAGSPDGGEAEEPRGPETDRRAGQPTAAPSGAHGAESRPPMQQPPVFTRADGRVSIEEHRIVRGGMSPEEREQLIALLEELLMRVRRA